MTYTFKLSSRLATLWAPVCAVAIAAAGCTDGDMSSMSPLDQLGNGAAAAPSPSAVSPKVAVVEAHKSLRFNSKSSTTWSTSGGTISSNGTFSSPVTGSFLVVGRGKDRVDSSRVTVVRPNQPRLVTVSPREVQLAVGQSVEFTSSVTLPNGTATALDLAWDADGGTIDKAGNYIAGAVPGSFKVIVSAPSAGVADTAVVTVTPLARHIVKMVLAPAAAVVIADSVQQYTATAEYDDGSVGPAMVSFGVSGGGAIDSKGRFTAGSTSGTYEVRAATPDGSAHASTPVSVAASTTTQLGITLPSGGSHEPAGFTQFGELRPPSSTPVSTNVVQLGCNTNAIVGCWWRFGAGESIKTDASAPIGSNVLEMSFPAGLQPGYGQDQFGGWKQSSPAAQYREIYESGWFKIPSADFETQLVGVKLWGYWGVGAAEGVTNPVQLYMIMQGNGTNTALMSSWNIWFGQQGADSRRLSQNMNLTTKIRANTWQHYETLMVLNDIGMKNGVLKVWLDGVQVLEYQDVEFRNAMNPSGFFGRKWHPIWGGQGGSGKTRTDHLWVNNVYMSGIPM